MTGHTTGKESESTAFLYPFIESEETDATSLLDDLAASARAKATESARLQRESLDEYAPALTAAGTQMAERFLRGGRLYTLGNGGSSTDAATLASLFSRPARGRPVAAWSLAADEAVVTALGNDVGFELIFKRQIIAHGRDRSEAIIRMIGALGGFVVEGIKTTVPLQKRILADPDFVAGKFDTHFIERSITVPSK